MKKTWIYALALLCSACASGGGGGGGRDVRYREFNVSMLNFGSASLAVVDDRYIVVNQEPIYVKQGEDNELLWFLPPGGAYYFLPKGSVAPGIVFDSPRMPQTECDIYVNRWTYRCTYKKATKKKYAYTINVTKDGTTIVKSDPTVMND
jgi:hypothetical protein